MPRVIDKVMHIPGVAETKKKVGTNIESIAKLSMDCCQKIVSKMKEVYKVYY